MLQILKNYTLTLFLFFQIPLTANEHLKKQVTANLDFIKGVFEVMYAPAQWKKEYSGWDLEIEIQKAKERISQSENLTLKESQQIIKDFFNSANDYHLGVTFHSTEKASLPFKIKGVNGRYFITYIDKAKLSSKVYDISVGDEMIGFDGKPIHEVITDLREKEYGIDIPTNRALAEILLTNRSAEEGNEVPRGPVMIEVKSKNRSTSSSYQLIWSYQPELIQHHFLADKHTKKELKPKLDKYHLMQKPGFKLDPTDDLHAMGSKKSFIPALGKKWWQEKENSPFYAYIFETKDHKKVGYIRIPHYRGFDEDFHVFGEIMNLFEQRTDAMIIDQVNNPGGSVFYLYAIASALANQPLSTPRHRMMITQEDVSVALDIIPLLELIENNSDAEQFIDESLSGYPMTYQISQFMLDFFRFIVTEWNAGRTLTTPYHLYGVDHINPHPDYTYTKPILLLVNELDFSGGDFFTAILQDNKRAKVFGARTAGAGGFVDACTFPNRTGIAGFRYTASIAERVNAVPIENLGVTPDILYEVTENDLQNGYKDYANAVLKALRELF